MKIAGIDFPESLLSHFVKSNLLSSQVRVYPEETQQIFLSSVI